MSLKAYKWAWAQTTERTPSFILLLALADMADDEGQCWPKLKTLAEKCKHTPRTIQRWLKKLESSGLLTVSQRCLPGRRQTSNIYTLAVDNYPDNLLPSQQNRGERDDRDDTPGVTLLRPATHDTAMSHLEPPVQSLIEPPLQLTNGNLIFPTGLTPSEKNAIERMSITIPNAQQLLDELSGAMAARTIRSSPVSWFRALTKRAQEGSFSPTYALRVADGRLRQSARATPLPSLSETALQSMQVLKKIIRPRSSRMTTRAGIPSAMISNSPDRPHIETSTSTARQCSSAQASKKSWSSSNVKETDSQISSSCKRATIESLVIRESET